MLIEGVHFTPDCPASDVAWKLVAVNLSDLAAMGARPVALLMGAGFGAGRDADWADAFAAGLGRVTAHFAVPLIGGDTTRSLHETALAITALGSVPPGQSLSRAGGQPGDDLWVSGTIGDAGLGLDLLLGRRATTDAALHRKLIGCYRRPMPRVQTGLALRGLASAAMDVSDGLLIDARRLAAASGCAAEIELAAVPVSAVAQGLLGAPTMAERTHLATSGDDYELLFAAPSSARARIRAAAGVAVTRIGRLTEGDGEVRLVDAPTPENLGYEHL